MTEKWQPGGAVQDWERLSWELRGLWNKAPITASVLSENAPRTVLTLGFGDPEAALDSLVGLLKQLETDKNIGAFSTALGLHSLGGDGNVDQRFANYGSHFSAKGRDSRSVRRWAEEGADKFAIKVLLAAEKYQPQVEIRANQMEDTSTDLFSVHVTVSRGLNVAPLSLHMKTSFDADITLSTFDATEDQSIEINRIPLSGVGMVEFYIFWVCDATPCILNISNVNSEYRVTNMTLNNGSLLWISKEKLKAPTQP